MKFRDWLKRILLVLGGIILFLFLLIWMITYHPPVTNLEEVVRRGEAPVLKAGQKLKVLSWNVQYMASKNYEFWYDKLDNSGPDTRPSHEDIEKTLTEVSRIIIEENPDVVLLQELHDNSKSTDYEDQLKRLMDMLPADYVCYAQAFYWKSAFVPIKQIWGSVGMKLAVISKYRISKAQRYQLPIMPKNWLERQFQFKRAILEARLSVEGGKEVSVMVTHFDAFSQGTDTMTKQVELADKLLTDRNKEGVPWLIAGDFNLIPPGAYELIAEDEKAYFNPQTEIKVLMDKFHSIPTLEQAQGKGREKWFTHFPNSRATGPDRTIDYYFYSDKLKLEDSYVRQNDTLHISDHLPEVAVFALPAKE